MWDGDPQALAYFIMGLAALLVLAPLALTVVRLLNETWLDPDWRRRRGG
jgi:DMSO/TMAO reductase YedYZ heme-binding membrane subunit